MTLSTLMAAFLSPTGALLLAELSFGLLLITLLVVIFAVRARSQRLRAARALLNERDALARSATDTFAAHCAALMPDRPLTDEERSDYHERSHALIGQWVQPWLQPGTDALTHAVREVMTIRHNDLHQIAALLRHGQKNTAPAEEVAQLQNELAQSRKAESERSAQLAEALRSVGIIVGEYGRKFGIDADYRVPQILRALVYLQAIDQGRSEEAAKAVADESLDHLVLISESELAPAATEQPAVLPSAIVNEPSVPAAAQPAGPEQPQGSAQPDEPSVDEILASIEPPPAAPSPSVAPLAVPSRDTKPAPASDIPAPDEQGVINLDEIDLPQGQAPGGSPEAGLSFDDIDALLDAEITRQMANKMPPAPTKLPSLDDDAFDLSKKP